MTPNYYLNQALKHQVFLERYKAGRVRDTTAALKEVETRLLSMLRALEVDSLDALTRTKFNELVREMALVEKTLMDRAVTQLDSEMDRFARYEMNLESRTLDNLLTNTALTVPKASSAYAAAMRTPLSATGDLLQPFVKTMSANGVKRTNQMLQRAYNEGWTVQQATRALRGTQANNFRDGITTIKTRQAEAVIRTSLQHVSSTARLEVWAKNKDLMDGYKFLATLDNRTTATCRSLDGQVFPLGKGPVPPVHINCRSTTVPNFNDGLDFLDEGATRSAEFGPVAADETFYTWLKKQDRQFVESSIGADRTKLLLDSGMTADRFRELQIDKQFRPVTLDEMKRLEPQFFQRVGL